MRGALLRLPEVDSYLAPLIGQGTSHSGAVGLVLELIKAAAGSANPPLAIDDLPTSTNVSAPALEACACDFLANSDMC